MPEQQLKAVNFDVCKQHPKLIAYHSNVSWTAAKLRPMSVYNPHTYFYQC